MKKNLFNDHIYYTAFTSDVGLVNWINSRKGHRKARWLKKLNRAINYVETHALFSRGASRQSYIYLKKGNAVWNPVKK